MLGEQIGEVAGFTVSMTAREAKTVKCEKVYAKVLRNRAVSLMQQFRDELGICVSVCRRNMAAEQKNSGIIDKHVRKKLGKLHGGLEMKDVKDHAAFFLRCRSSMETHGAKWLRMYL